MSYLAPELLLVGAAHNLVLGAVDTKDPGLNEDHPGDGIYRVEAEFDSGGW